MSKILITSDLHIHAHRSDSRRIEDGLQCLQWIYDTAKQHQCKTVVFSGDFLHHRFNLSSYIYSKAAAIVSEAKRNGIQSIFLVGNHDMYSDDNWHVHSLTPMQELATVIDKPTQMEVEGVLVDFLPYTPTPSKWINEPPFNHPARVLFSHLAILDAILNSRYNMLSVEDDTKEKEVIQAEMLHKWEKVWLGHYHCAQKVSNQVEYIGSPMQLTFAEVEDKKHVIVFDLETFATEYIENDVSPRFYVVKSEKQLDKMNVKDGYVQLDFPIDQKFNIIKRLNKLGVRDVAFGPNSGQKDGNAGGAEQALSTISSLFGNKEKLIDVYMETIKNPSGLDREILKKIGKEIVQSAK